MNRSDFAIDSVINQEGGFVNDPHDPGGATKYGISIRVHKDDIGDKDGDGDIDSDDVRLLKQEEARVIYKKEYWDRIHGDSLHPGVAFYLLDTAVNIGLIRAIGLLQRACNAKVDYIIGKGTKSASWCPGVLERLHDLRIRYYQSLPGFRFYGRGWTRRSNEVFKVASGIKI
jgi:lysozyme family protein